MFSYLPSLPMNVTILGPKSNYTNVLPQPLIKRHIFEITKMILMHSPQKLKGFSQMVTKFSLLKKNYSLIFFIREYIRHCSKVQFELYATTYHSKSNIRCSLSATANSTSNASFDSILQDSLSSSLEVIIFSPFFIKH